MSPETDPTRRPGRTPSTKCTDCGKTKTLENTYVRSNGYFTTYCKACHTDRVFQHNLKNRTDEELTARQQQLDREMVFIGEEMLRRSEV